VAAIPSEWATGDDVHRLETAVLDRSAEVHDLIESVRVNARAPFEDWLAAKLSIPPN